MSSRPVRIAQISDLHIKPPGALAYGRVDTAKAMERCVAALNEFDPAPDFVVISGDLADTPLAEEYEYLNQMLAKLKIPFAGVPGNHNSRELMRAAFPRANYASASGPLNQKIELDGLDLVLLDSSVQGRPHGELEASSLQWLDEILASSGDRPALLFLHHPPFRPGIWHMDRRKSRQRHRSSASCPAAFAHSVGRRGTRSSRDVGDVRGRTCHHLPSSQSRC